MPDSGKRSDAGQRRTRYEIWAEILEACSGDRRTQGWLIRHLGLRHDYAQDALDFLIERDLITTSPDEMGNLTYEISERGRMALAQYYMLVDRYFSHR
jgi:predicted transcriptional regulator